VSKPWSPIARAKARIAAEVEANVVARPNTALLDKFNGFEAHLKAVSSSEEAQKRFEAARQAERARDKRIRAAMKKEEQ
jgi:hypothetical protein